MRIEHIRILHFAGIHDRELTFGEGINILEGPNESGKSTVCHFIKFMLYGVSDKEEKKLIFGWNGADKPVASGTMTVSVGGGRFRVERSQSATGKGSCKVVELGSNTTVLEGKKPGEVWFGVDSEVFAHTAFVGQNDGSRVDGKAIGEGIENILFSADEDVNTQKALKKLDEARITLLYKHQNGGKILEAQNQLEELELRFNEAVAGNKEIIVKEGAVRDATEKMAENDRRIAALEDGLDYHATYMLKKRYDEWQRLSDEQEQAEKALDTLRRQNTVDGFLPDEGYAEQVRVQRDDLLRVLTDINAVNAEIGGTVQMLSGAGEPAAPAEDGMIDEVEKRHRKSRSVFFAGALCLVAAIVCGVLAVLFWPKVSIAVPIALGIGAAVLLTAGAVLLVLGGKARKQNRVLFARYNVGDTDGLRKALAEEGQKQRAAENIRARLDALAEKKQTLTAQKDAMSAQIADLVTPWEKKNADEFLSAYRNYRGQDTKLGLEIELLGRNCRTIEAEFRGQNAEDLARRFASLRSRGEIFGDPEKMSVDALTRELNFLKMQQKVLSDRKHEDEKTLAGLYAGVAQPSAIYDRMEQVSGALKEMKKRHGAYLLAYQALERAGGRMKENVAPRLSEYAGRMMSAVTEEKYSTLGVGKELGIEFTAGNMTQEASFMSAGTRDAAYISLRLALIKLLYQKELPMPVFDESFAQMDDRRLRAMFALLAKAASEDGMQMIVSTCQEREARIMARVGDFSHILLT